MLSPPHVCYPMFFTAQSKAASAEVPLRSTEKEEDEMKADVGPDRIASPSRGKVASCRSQTSASGSNDLRHSREHVGSSPEKPAVHRPRAEEPQRPLGSMPADRPNSRRRSRISNAAPAASRSGGLRDEDEVKMNDSGDVMPPRVVVAPHSMAPQAPSGRPGHRRRRRSEQQSAGSPSGGLRASVVARRVGAAPASVDGSAPLANYQVQRPRPTIA